jgi:hypothetical protein
MISLMGSFSKIEQSSPDCAVSTETCWSGTRPALSGTNRRAARYERAVPETDVDGVLRGDAAQSSVQSLESVSPSLIRVPLRVRGLNGIRSRGEQIGDFRVDRGRIILGGRFFGLV